MNKEKNVNVEKEKKEKESVRGGTGQSEKRN